MGAHLNYNRISTDGFSNPASSRLYDQQWPSEPKVRQRYRNGQQCGGCSYFARAGRLAYFYANLPQAGLRRFGRRMERHS